MKRTARLCAALLLAATLGAQAQFQPLPFEQIAGPNRSIYDPKAKLSATVPAGWTLRRAGRSDKGETSILLGSPKTPAAAPTLYYGFSDTARPLPADVPAMLRDGAAKKAQQRLERDGATGYANRAESFAAKKIGGLPALSWEASYTKEGQPWLEFLTRIATDRGTILFFLNAPEGEMAAVRPAFERMIETTRIGAPVTAQIGEMAFVQLLEVSRLEAKAGGAPDGVTFTFLVARNAGVTGQFTIKETKDMGIAGQSYLRGTNEKLGENFGPTTTMHGGQYVTTRPKLAALAAVDVTDAQILTIELPGAPLEAGAEAAIHLNVGFNKAVEKLTFYTKVPGRSVAGD